MVSRMSEASYQILMAERSEVMKQICVDVLWLFPDSY